MRLALVPILALVTLAGAASAASPDDSSVTAVGAQGVFDGGLGALDVSPLVSERLRWTFGDGDRTAVALADVRFELQPSSSHPWEENRVRTLGVELNRPGWTFELGRSAVSHGGPRLVDGVQALHRAGALTVGGWAGLAPDLFTTRPMLRGGGGPIVAWEQTEVQASLVGEALWAAGGLDRLGLLTQARYAPSSAGSVSGRLDAQLSGGKLALADGAVFGRWTPDRAVHLDALYDAYSSLRYLQTGGLDPDLQRFVARLQALGLGGVLADLPDPSVYQLFGAGGSWQAASAVAPRVALTGRYRYHALAENRYALLDPQAGVFGLADGRLDATADLAWTWRGGAGSREDIGLDLVFDPQGDGRLTFDGSVRGIADPAFGGKPGWYADLFVDLLPPTDARGLLDGTVLVAGLSATREPSDVPGVGVSGLLWVQHRQWLHPAAHLRPEETSACLEARRADTREAWAEAWWAGTCGAEALDALRRTHPTEPVLVATQPLVHGDGPVPEAVEGLLTSMTTWRVQLDSGVEGVGLDDGLVAAFEPVRAAVDRCLPENASGRVRLLGAIGPSGAVDVGAIDGDPAIARCVTGLDAVRLAPGPRPRPLDLTVVVDRL